MRGRDPCRCSFERGGLTRRPICGREWQRRSWRQLQSSNTDVVFRTQCCWLSPTTQLLLVAGTIAAEWLLLVWRLYFQGRRKIMERDEGRRPQEEMKEEVNLIVVLVAHLGFDFVFFFSLNTKTLWQANNVHWVIDRRDLLTHS